MINHEHTFQLYKINVSISLAWMEDCVSLPIMADLYASVNLVTLDNFAKQVSMTISNLVSHPWIYFGNTSWLACYFLTYCPLNVGIWSNGILTTSTSYQHKYYYLIDVRFWFWYVHPVIDDSRRSKICSFYL